MDKKILKWNFIFQYGWVLTNIFNAIVLLPLYLKNIDTDTLGVWLATGSILGWMTLVDPGIGEVLQQKIAELRGQDQSREISKTIGSGYITSGIIFLISLALGFACYFFIGAVIDKDVSRYPYLSMALSVSIAATGLSLVSFGMLGMNQGLHNSEQVAICSVTANFLFLFVNVVFLYTGYGVLSIAIANLVRAVYINIYNIISMFRLMKRQSLEVIFEKLHFKRFVRIFSFTSASKIITSLSYSVEMIVLARYIPPAMITMFEINKRPVNIIYALIGRHSVALMPSISHAKGRSDKASILELINKQVRFYTYAALFVSLFFCFNYDYLIATWTGEGQFAGFNVLYLMAGGLFLSLISFFMASVGYALGDIRMNSIYNIIRNVFFGLLIFFAAKWYGIIGTLTVSLAVTFFADLFFYAYRLLRLGYLSTSFFKNAFGSWVFIVPVIAAGGSLFRFLTTELLPAGSHFSKLTVNGGIFTLFFISVVLLADRQIRQKTRWLLTSYVVAPLSRLRRA
ncbi:MAG TPA: MATE family efflux transporter [Flavisolibacter sp.]